ncbi:MAG: class F sortase [Chloroflexi bacterium]|nr:class F sortase [Chloroflexota bacterium]
MDDLPGAPKPSVLTNRKRLSVLILAVGMAALGSAAALFVLTSAGLYQNDAGWSGPGTVSAFDLRDLSIPTYAAPAVTAPEPTEAPPQPPASDAAGDRIVIPSIGVSASISVKGMDAQGVMQTPNGPWDVSWYDFSARPGFGSNAVFSGHVDYVNVGPAVFSRLGELVANDLIEVQLVDGTVYQYRVVSMESVYAATADVGAIVGPSAQEQLTLITCAGSFNAAAAEYDQRLIVRAERVSASAASAQ